MHYEYQGKHYEIDTDDAAVAKQKIQAHLGQTTAPAPAPEKKGVLDYAKDFGRSATSLADTGLNAITGTLDQLAYPVARAYYGTQMTPQAAAERAEAETTSPKDVLGHAMGIVNSPAYQNELSRRITGTIGQGVQAVAQPIAQTTGMPQQDVNSMLGSGMLAATPTMARAGSAVGRAAYAAEPYVAAAVKSPVTAPVAAVKGAVNFGRGVIEGISNPEYNPKSSAMVPLGETYYPEAAVQRYMGNMPGVPAQTLEQLQTQARPTSELVNDWRTQTAAKLAPKTPEGQPLVPLAGRGIEAAGERVARGYMQNPITGISDLLSESVLGFPVTAISRMTQNAGSSYLGHRANFAPGFVEKAAAEAAGNIPPTMPPPGGGGGMPATPGVPTPAPAAPSAANYMQRMGQLAQQVNAVINPKTPPAAARIEPTMGPGPVTAPTPIVTPAQVNLRQQLNAPQNAPPNTMSMMTGKELPDFSKMSPAEIADLMDQISKTKVPKQAPGKKPQHFDHPIELNDLADENYRPGSGSAPFKPDPNTPGQSWKNPLPAKEAMDQNLMNTLSDQGQYSGVTGISSDGSKQFSIERNQGGPYNGPGSINYTLLETDPKTGQRLTKITKDYDLDDQMWRTHIEDHSTGNTYYYEDGKLTSIQAMPTKKGSITMRNIRPDSPEFKKLAKPFRDIEAEINNIK
jgi:hypothetical protein